MVFFYSFKKIIVISTIMYIVTIIILVLSVSSILWYINFHYCYYLPTFIVHFFSPNFKYLLVFELFIHFKFDVDFVIVFFVNFLYIIIFLIFQTFLCTNFLFLHNFQLSQLTAKTEVERKAIQVT